MDEVLGAVGAILLMVARFVWEVVFRAVIELVFQALAWLVLWPWRKAQSEAGEVGASGTAEGRHER